MAEDRPTTSQAAEQTEDRTVSSDRFDDVVQSVEGLKQSVDELDSGSSVLFDERRPAANGGGLSDVPGLGTSPGLPDPSTDPPLGIDPTPSNRDLKRRINAHGRRLKEVEERLDDVVDALDGLVDVLAADEQRPVGDVLQDVLDDEITQRQAAAELGWSRAKVSQVVAQIHE